MAPSHSVTETAAPSASSNPSRGADWIAAAALVVIASIEVAYGLSAGVVVGPVIALDPSAHPLLSMSRGVVAAAALIVTSLGVALLTLAGALGIASGNPWGKGLGTVGAIVWLGSGCAPLSLLTLAILAWPTITRRRAVPPPTEPPLE